MKYERITRWLHAGIALGVIVQLACSLFMDVPAPGHSLPPAGYLLFSVHRWSGITVVALVIMHWLWNLSGHVAGGWGHLFPWFSGARLQRLVSNIKEIPQWLHGEFPDQQEETIPLAGAIHGLGLLVVSAMAFSGAIIFFGLGPEGTTSGFVGLVRQGHGYLGNLMWLYFAGHAGIAVLHQVRGDRLISNMFNLITPP
jgi:cytochrome b561